VSTSAPVREDLILEAIKRGRHTNDLFFTHVKDGPTTVRRDDSALRIIDGLAFRKSWTKPCVTGYEVKCSRSDWLRDDKWTDYLQYCHQFYLAAPKGVVEPGEVPAGVGLIHYLPDSQRIRLAVKAAPQKAELDAMLMFYILLTREESDRHPFFGSNREFWKAWLENKPERQKLGQHVGSELTRRNALLAAETQELKREVVRLERCARDLQQLEAALRSVGVNPSPWTLDRELRALNNGLPTNFAATVRLAKRVVDELQNMLPRTEAAR